MPASGKSSRTLQPSGPPGPSPSTGKRITSTCRWPNRDLHLRPASVAAAHSCRIASRLWLWGNRMTGIFAIAVLLLQTPNVQLVQPQGPAAPPPVITLQDALDRAKQVDAQYNLALADAVVAREDRLQAKASLLPSVSHTTQYLGTQGNGVAPSGRFVTNDGVHVYRSWGIVHQDITPNTFFKSSYRRAQAAEALAAAKVQIAQRGLAVTVTRNYYTFVTAQRKYAT